MAGVVLSELVKVFISSKQSEFAVERSLLKHEIENSAFASPVLAEDWSPGSASVREVFVKKVQGCPIYVTLLGQIYSESTQEEYVAAAENPYREMLIYLKQCDKRDRLLVKLIENIKPRHATAQFTNAADLVARFASDLVNAVGRMAASLVGMGVQPPTSHSSRNAGNIPNDLEYFRDETDNPLVRKWLKKRDQLLSLGIPVGEVQGQPSFDVTWLASLQESLRLCSKRL